MRLEGLDRLFCMLVRLVKPIEFDAIDRQPVDVIVLMLIPTEPGHDHVAALAAVARAMRDDGLLRAIRKAGSPAALYDQFRRRRLLKAPSARVGGLRRLLPANPRSAPPSSQQEAGAGRCAA